MVNYICHGFEVNTCTYSVVLDNGLESRDIIIAFFNKKKLLSLYAYSKCYDVNTQAL